MNRSNSSGGNDSPLNLSSCLSTMSLPSLGEMEQTVCMLERGTIITKYYPRRRPEQKTLMLRRETRQLIWSSANNTSSRSNANHEGSLELREVREVRLGKASKDFEKWHDECKTVDFTKCFVVYYGSEFKLRSLSVVGKLTPVYKYCRQRWMCNVVLTLLYSIFRTRMRELDSWSTVYG